MTKTITTTYYTFNELKALGNREAIETATEWLKSVAIDSIIDFYFNEFKNSANGFLKIFGTEVTDWSYSPYDNSFIAGDIDAYNELTNEEKKEAIAEYNALNKENCPLSGMCYDFYIFDAVKEVAGEKLTFNKVTKVLREALDIALEAFNKDELQSANDIERLKELADANDYYFNDKGVYTNI